MDLEPDGDVVDVCVTEEPCEEDQEEAEECPAVIVEEVPGARLAGGQGYSSQVLLYSDQTYLKQNVGDEKKVATKMGAGEPSILQCFQHSTYFWWAVLFAKCDHVNC